MATPALQTEYVARAVEEAIRADLPTWLSTVQTRWAAREPIVLPPPAEITFGFRENVLDLFIDDFPRVAVIAAPRSPLPGQTSQKIALALHSVLVEWQVLGPTVREATLMGWRYGEALLETILAAEPRWPYEIMSITPPVDEGQASSLRPDTGPNIGAELGLLAGGSTTIGLQVRYTR